MINKARVIGTGSYLPKKVLSNFDLETMVDTTDEWIFTRTGMKERRIAAEDEFPSDMGFEAAKIALADAHLTPLDIDLILVATLAPDYIFPSTACLIQAKLQAINAAAVDIQAACSGYLYALSMAQAFVQSGVYRHVLVVATEKLSSIVNYKDRSTCILFGDGAAACVVSNKGRGLLINNVCLGADGQFADLLLQPAGGARNPASFETVTANQHYIHMGGNEIFKHAVRRMEFAAKECLERSGIREDQISWMIPHQANIRIIDAMAKRFQVPMEKVFLTLHKYGNTSASSVGIALDELLKSHQLKAGENLVLVAFGAGLTWGASVLTYGEADE